MAPPAPKHRRVARARRGTGSLYRQRHRDGTIAPTWWTKLYVNGRPVRESTGTTDREVAEGVLRDYATMGSRDPKEAEKRLKPLRRFFAGWRAANIDGRA